MNPMVFLYGFLFFIICLMIHITVWRIKISKISALLLVLIFVVIPGVGFSIVMLTDAGGIKDILSTNAIELAEILILHISLSSAYIASYPAARAISPSLGILLIIKTSKEGKMTKEDIIKEYKGSIRVPTRFDTLRVYNLVSEKDACYKLKPLGKLIIIIFIFYRKLLGISAGSG